jgi:hypothetical protein
VTTTGPLLGVRPWPSSGMTASMAVQPAAPIEDDDQAGASRATGFSTIGKLITADNRPSRIESHQTAS